MYTLFKGHWCAQKVNKAGVNISWCGNIIRHYCMLFIISTRKDSGRLYISKLHIQYDLGNNHFLVSVSQNLTSPNSRSSWNKASPPALHINMNSSNYNESQGLAGQQDYDIRSNKLPRQVITLSLTTAKQLARMTSIGKGNLLEDTIDTVKHLSDFPQIWVCRGASEQQANRRNSCSDVIWLLNRPTQVEM